MEVNAITAPADRLLPQLLARRVAKAGRRTRKVVDSCRLVALFTRAKEPEAIAVSHM